MSLFNDNCLFRWFWKKFAFHSSFRQGVLISKKKQNFEQLKSGGMKINNVFLETFAQNVNEWLESQYTSLFTYQSEALIGLICLKASNCSILIYTLQHYDRIFFLWTRTLNSENLDVRLNRIFFTSTVSKVPSMWNDAISVHFRHEEYHFTSMLLCQSQIPDASVFPVSGAAKSRREFS